MIEHLAAAVVAVSLSGVPASEPPKPCRDATVRVIDAAGWKGRDRAIAYAVAWRESNHRPEINGGAAGLFQLQWSVWSGTRFWPADPFDPYQNARAAYRIWKLNGWRPWGLNASGTAIDGTDYAAWSPATQYAWIWRGYAAGRELWDELPKRCRR
jgi:hypothetical protein